MRNAPCWACPTAGLDDSCGAWKPECTNSTRRWILTVLQRGPQAQRNPVRYQSVFGSKKPRLALRTQLIRAYHDPSRATLTLPVSGPGGFRYGETL